MTEHKPECQGDGCRCSLEGEEIEEERCLLCGRAANGCPFQELFSLPRSEEK